MLDSSERELLVGTMDVVSICSALLTTYVEIERMSAIAEMKFDTATCDASTLGHTLSQQGTCSRRDVVRQIVVKRGTEMDFKERLRSRAIIWKVLIDNYHRTCKLLKYT